MSQPTTGILLNSTNPSAPAGNQNVKPQSDGAVPMQSVSFYPQPATDSLLGVVKPDGTTIIIADDGTISTETAGASSIIQAVQQQLYVFANDTGTANAYIVAQTPPPVIVIGSKVVFLAANANTGPSTLTIDSSPISTAPITKEGGLPLTGGEIDAGQVIEAVFDGTNFQIVGGGSGSIGTGGGGGGSGSALGDVIPAGAIDGVNVTFTVPTDGSPGPGGGGGGGGSGVAFVQSASSYVNLDSTISQAFASNNAAGNCLIVDVIWSEQFTGAGSSIAVTDSQGNTYTLVNTSAEQNNYFASVFIAPNCKAGANTVTVTFTGFISANQGMAVAIHEYSGIATTLPLDVFTFTPAGGGSPTSLTASTTTSVGPDLLHVFGATNTASTVPFTDTLGATARESQSNSGTVGNSNPSYFTSFDILEGAAGTFSETVEFGTAVNYGFLYVIALKSTTAGGGGGGSTGGARGNLYRNGVLQNPLGPTPDYTIVGTTITMAIPPVAVPSPDWLVWVYLSGSVGPPGPAGGGITTLVGDVTAGPGVGTVSATLAASGVTAGTYEKVTVDAKGRVTSGASLSAGDVSAALGVQPENTFLAGPIGPTSPAATPTFRTIGAGDLPATTVTPGSYTSANITVEADGRLTAAANGSGAPTPIQETPSGTMNGVNLTFTLANTPNPAASLDVYLNGVWQGPNWISVSGATITFTVAPKSTDKLRARYTY